MMDELKELSEGNLVLLEAAAMEFTGAAEMEVSGLRTCSSDDGEMIVVEMDDFCLVAHTFSSEPRYFIYQITESDSLESLEMDGCKFLGEDDDFKNKIVIRDEMKPIIYKHSETGAVYELTGEDEDEVSVCEYTTSGSYMTHILIEMRESGRDISLTVYQGFEIDEESFSIPCED